MEAKEAPEKLWWSECAVWHTNLNSERYIEYTRTDAFIEKAVEWLSNNLAKETSLIASGIVSVDFKNVIEQFQKAMKL